VQIRTNSRI